MGDLVNNFISPFGPDKWFRVLVIATDGFFLADINSGTLLHTPANPLPRDFPEPSFY